VTSAGIGQLICARLPMCGVACETASNGFIVLYMMVDGESVPVTGMTSARGG
jgi:hypothetical protein